MEELQRQSANLLIDAVSSFDSDADDEANSRAILTVIDDLERIGAIPIAVTEADDGDLHADVDISNLLTPAAMMVSFLVTRLAQVTGRDRHTVIVELREAVTSA